MLLYYINFQLAGSFMYEKQIIGWLSTKIAGDQLVG